jgi:hypothetical protein
MTVLPYLFDHYYDTSDAANNHQYFTERELNGETLLETCVALVDVRFFRRNYEAGGRTK